MIVVQTIAKTSRVHKDSEIIENCGELFLGENCHIKKGVVINCYGGTIRIANNVTIGEYVVLYGHGNITIDENVAIAPHSVLSAQKHIVPADVPLRYSGEVISSIEIQKNCIISAHVTITGGVTIGHDTLIGAGSVITKDIPNSVFACGSPCKVIKKHNRNSLYGFCDQTG